MSHVLYPATVRSYVKKPPNGVGLVWIFALIVVGLVFIVMPFLLFLWSYESGWGDWAAIWFLIGPLIPLSLVIAWEQRDTDPIPKPSIYGDFRKNAAKLLRSVGVLAASCALLFGLVTLENSGSIHSDSAVWLGLLALLGLVAICALGATIGFGIGASFGYVGFVLRRLASR